MNNNNNNNSLHLYIAFLYHYLALSPHLCLSDHISIEMLPSYRPLICRTQPAVVKTVQVWSEEAISQLHDCFENTDWELFAQSTDLEEYDSSVLAYIAFCTNTVLATKTIKVFPNQKPWFDRHVCGLCLGQRPLLRHAAWSYAEVMCWPISDNFNLSLQQVVVSMCLKATTIVPVPKKQAVRCLSVYRPIALTPIIMKCFERLILSHIKVNILTDLDSHKFAYFRNRSTEDAISHFIHACHIWSIPTHMLGCYLWTCGLRSIQ